MKRNINKEKILDCLNYLFEFDRGLKFEQTKVSSILSIYSYLMHNVNPKTLKFPEYITMEEVCARNNLAMNTVRKCYRILGDYGLLKLKHRGQGKKIHIQLTKLNIKPETKE